MHPGRGVRPAAGVVMRDSIRSSFRGAPLGASPESILPIVVMDSGFVRILSSGRALRGPVGTPRNDVRLLILARRLFQNLLQRVALHPRDVVLIFQQGAERVAHYLRRQRAGVEFGQRGGPVDGL